MRIILVAAALAFPATLSGQVSQTPDGARQFLLQVLSANNVGMAEKSEGYWNLVSRIVTTSTSDREYKSDGPDNLIETAAKKDDCTFYLTTSVAPNSSENTARADVSIHRHSVGYMEIDFRKLAKAELNGALIYLHGLPEAYRVRLPSDEMATRVAFAMEFLRQSCDPTAGTGF